MKSLISTAKLVLKKLVFAVSIAWIPFLTGCGSYDFGWNLQDDRLGYQADSFVSTLRDGRTPSILFTMNLLGMRKIPEPDFRSVTLGIFDSFYLAPFSDTTLVQHVHASWTEPLHPQHLEAEQVTGSTALETDSNYMPMYTTRHGTLVNSMMTSRGQSSYASKGMAPGVLVYRMNVPTYVGQGDSLSKPRQLYSRPGNGTILANGLRDFVHKYPQRKPAAINISMVGTFSVVETARDLGIVIVIATGNNPERSVEKSATQARSKLQLVTMRPWVVTASMSEILPPNSELPDDSYYVQKNFYGSFVRDGVHYRVINTGTSCQTVAIFCVNVPIHQLSRSQLQYVSGSSPRTKKTSRLGIEIVLSNGQRHFLHGASFASPAVVAAMAYLKAKWPDATNDLLMERLLLTSTLVGRNLSEEHTSLEAISPSRGDLSGTGIIILRTFNFYLGRIVNIRFHEHFGRGIINVARALQPICLSHSRACIYVDDETGADLSPAIGFAVMRNRGGHLRSFRFRDDLGSLFQVDLTEKIRFRESEGVHLTQMLSSMATEVEMDIASKNSSSVHVRFSKQLQVRTTIGEPLPVATSSQRQQLLLTALPVVYPYQNLIPKVRSFHARYDSPQKVLGLDIGFATAIDNIKHNYAYLTLKTGSNRLQLSYTLHYAQEQGKILESSLGGGFGQIVKTTHLYHNLEISLQLADDVTLFGNYGHANVFTDFLITPALLQLKPHMTLQNFALGLAKRGILNEQDSFTLLLTKPLALFLQAGDGRSTAQSTASNYPWRIDAVYRYKFASQGLFLLFANARSGIEQKYLYEAGCAFVMKFD